MELWELADLATPWSLYVAATLRVAERLEAGAMPVDDLAAAVGAEPGALARVLRQLAGRGVFDEPTPGVFALNDAARPLLEPGQRAAFDLDGFGGLMAHAWSALLYSVRTGQAAFPIVFGQTFWQELETRPGVAAEFDDFLGPAGHGWPDPQVLADEADWAGVRSVVDVGGGTGALLASVLRARTGLRGVLVEAGRVTEHARTLMSEAGVMDRVTLAPGSFFDPLPAGADLYLLKSVLSNWADAEAVAILRRCAEAARPGGRVVLVNGVTDADAADPNLLMLVLVAGRDRTLVEFRELAGKAGLTVSKAVRQPSGRFVVECVPT